MVNPIRRRTGVFDLEKAIPFLVAAVASMLLSFLLSDYSRVRIPQYSAGDVARADVVVPSDILIMDEDATRARKAVARADVLPIYRYDESVQRSPITRISQVFAACRQTLQANAAASRIVSFRKLPQTVQTAIESEVLVLAPQPGAELLDFFVREHFEQELEDSLTSSLRPILESWLVADEQSLITTAGNIEVVKPVGKENKIVSENQVLTLDRARQKLRDLVNDSLKAPAQIKRAISEWLGAMPAANLQFDLQATEARRTEAAESVDPVLRQLKRGKVIVRHGDEISADQLQQIEAVRKRTPTLRSLPQFIGTNLLILCLLLIVGLLLHSVSLRQWNRAKLAALYFLALIANLILVKLLWFISGSLSRNFVASPFNDERLFFFALPFAFGGMLITLLAGDRIAPLFLILYCPLAAQVTGAGFQDFLYIVVANLVGIVVVRGARQRMAIIGAGFKLSASAAALVIAVQLAQQAPLTFVTGAFGAGLAFLSGPLTAGLLTFSLPLCERLFLVTTEIRLSELGNLNLPLLRQLMLRAPGTYNHSIAVGTLSEGAAGAIGLSPLFVRVACLYHDVGKSLRPQFFIENQDNGMNPHEKLSPQESVRIIKEHVTEGIRMARAAKLPATIIDVIPQHHGTKRLSYFYDKAKQMAGSDVAVASEDDFRYPGPKPQTKEAAVIMLADALEAAARTLPEHSQERLLAMIQKIVSTTTADGQLAECDLTLSEIDRITFSFLDTLSSFYHSRIVYPGFDFAKKAADNGRESSGAI